MGGSKLTRACICEVYAPDALELHVPQLLCPFCYLWPAVRRLAAAGGKLFPGRAGKKALTAPGISERWRNGAELAVWAPTPLEGVRPEQSRRLGGPPPSYFARASGILRLISPIWTSAMKSPELWLRLWSRHPTTNEAELKASKVQRLGKNCRHSA